MGRNRWIAGRLGLAGAFLPAQARDPAELACPTAAISAADRRVLDEAAGRYQLEEAAPRGIIERAIRTCAERYGWNEIARRTATVHTRALVFQTLFRQRLAGRRGLDLAAFEAEVLRDRALIEAAAEMRDRPPEVDAMLMRIWPRIEPLLVQGRDERDFVAGLSIFFVSIAAIEGMRIRFSRHDGSRCEP
jgi:hypothetical protein